MQTAKEFMQQLEKDYSDESEKTLLIPKNNREYWLFTEIWQRCKDYFNQMEDTSEVIEYPHHIELKLTNCPCVIMLPKGYGIVAKIGDIVVSKKSNEFPYHELITIQKIVSVDGDKVKTINYNGLYWTASIREFNDDFLALANEEQIRLFNLEDYHCEDGSVSDYRDK